MHLHCHISHHAHAQTRHLQVAQDPRRFVLIAELYPHETVLAGIHCGTNMERMHELLM